MLGFIIMIAVLAAMFKLTGFMLGLGFKIVGLIFSLLGYIISAALMIAMFGMATLVIPAVLIVAVFSLIFYLAD